MNLIKCTTLQVYLNKLGGEISMTDLVFILDIQEIYVSGKPYGKDPTWNEIPKPKPNKVGDLIKYDGTYVPIENFNDEIKPSIAGIYIGDNSEGKHLIIPGNKENYTYQESGIKWCEDSIIPFDINPEDLLDVPANLVDLINKSNGKSQTEKILAAAAANSKPNTYFPAANFCKLFAPGFHDGKWYLPSTGELHLLNGISMNPVLESIKTVYPDLQVLSTQWSSTQRTDSDSYCPMIEYNDISSYASNNSTDPCVIPMLQID